MTFIINLFFVMNYQNLHYALQKKVYTIIVRISLPTWELKFVSIFISPSPIHQIFIMYSNFEMKNERFNFLTSKTPYILEKDKDWMGLSSHFTLLLTVDLL